MDESDLQSYQQYLKEAISLALTLSKNKNPTIYELGHYLADNVLSKILKMEKMEELLRIY